MQCVNVVEDARAESASSRMAADVAIRAGGREYHQFVAVPRGEPEAPLGWDDVVEKFRSLVASRITEERCRRIVALVHELDQHPSIRPLTELLRDPV